MASLTGAQLYHQVSNKSIDVCVYTASATIYHKLTNKLLNLHVHTARGAILPEHLKKSLNLLAYAYSRNIFTRMALANLSNGATNSETTTFCSSYHQLVSVLTSIHTSMIDSSMAAATFGKLPSDLCSQILSSYVSSMYGFDTVSTSESVLEEGNEDVQESKEKWSLLFSPWPMLAHSTFSLRRCPRPKLPLHAYL